MDVGSISGMPRLVTPAEAQTGVSPQPAAIQLQGKVERHQPVLIQGWDAVIRSMEHGNKVEMEFDKDINRVVVRVVSGKTRETIAQFPPEELISFMKRFRQYISLSVEGV